MPSIQYRFGACALVPHRREFLVDGRPVRLQPLVYDLLQHCVRNPNRLLAKEELIAQLWPSGVASDEALTAAIGKLRRALAAAGPGHAARLATCFGKGFVFDAEVQAIASEAAPASCLLRVRQARLRTDDPAHAWAREGIPCLLHHHLSSLEGAALADIADALAPADDAPRDHGGSEPRGAYGVELIACPPGERWAITATVWQGKDTSFCRVVEGEDLSSLIYELALSIGHALGWRLAAVDPAMPADRLGSVVRVLEELGEVQTALELLEGCSTRDGGLEPRQRDLHVRLLRRRGRFKEARARGAAYLNDTAPPARLLTLVELCRLETMTGNYEAVDRRLGELIRGVNDGHAHQLNLADRVLVHSVLADQSARLNRPEAANEAALAIRLAEKMGEPRALIEAHSSMGAVRNMQADNPSAMTHLEQAHGLALAHRMTQMQAREAMRMAVVQCDLGQSANSRRSAAIAIELLTERGDLHVLHSAHFVSMLSAIWAERPDLVDHHRKARDRIVAQMDTPVAHSQIIAHLATFHWNLNQTAVALQLLEQIEPTFQLEAIQMNAERYLRQRLWRALVLLTARRPIPADLQIENLLRETAHPLVAAFLAQRHLMAGDLASALDAIMVPSRSSPWTSESISLRISQSWLLIVSGEVALANQILEEMRAIGVDLPALEFVSYAGALAAGRAAPDVSRWTTLASRVATIRTRQPQMLSPRYLDSFVQGKAPCPDVLLMVPH